MVSVKQYSNKLVIAAVAAVLSGCGANEIASPGSGGNISIVNNTTTGYQSEPTITALADGRFVVAWTDGSESGNEEAHAQKQGTKDQEHLLRFLVIKPQKLLILAREARELLRHKRRTIDRGRLALAFGLCAADVAYLWSSEAPLVQQEQTASNMSFDEHSLQCHIVTTTEHTCTKP